MHDLDPEIQAQYISFIILTTIIIIYIVFSSLAEISVVRKVSSHRCLSLTVLIDLPTAMKSQSCKLHAQFYCLKYLCSHKLNFTVSYVQQV